MTTCVLFHEDDQPIARISPRVFLQRWVHFFPKETVIASRAFFARFAVTSDFVKTL